MSVVFEGTQINIDEEFTKAQANTTSNGPSIHQTRDGSILVKSEAADVLARSLAQANGSRRSHELG